MELRHLRYFAAVAETRHFGKAAENLHMAQPPLSQAIRRLETELGVELFTRTTRQVALTGAGEVFRTDVERILKAVDDAVARVGRFASGAEGVLRVGLTGSASYRQLPALARLVKREMPQVMLEVHTEMLTPAQEAGLIERRLDVGVLRPPVRQEGIAHRPIADEPLIVAVPEEHWLGEADSVRMEQLRHEDFIMYGATLGSVVNDAVVRSCLASGYYPHRAYEVTETSAALALVAAGLGVAVLPDSIRSAPREGVLCKDIEDALSVPLVLAWRADDDSPLLNHLLGVLDQNDVFLAATERETQETHELTGGTP
ncbi:LysR substrate-binding domain-containing protein [Streptomyces fulvoviolaceus]|uniref:LysR substrate-binding domain-containing protein n=1 Tax=Streptomyces fulvoviolaceus TaxID=285535 RepID=UPI00069383A7|nr:LysR substrate-binding domain-containing protein [Streptomyces fulvoviolaceus]MCT9078663.1 LysR substrate-binding domain-containing protein [Streptomyces fulvoviolaceus]